MFNLNVRLLFFPQGRDDLRVVRISRLLIVASPLAEALQSTGAPTSTSSAAMESAPPQVSQVSHLKSLKSLISPPCRPHRGGSASARTAVHEHRSHYGRHGGRPSRT